MNRTITKLNNIDHAELTVETGYSKELGDGVMTCLAYTAEMRTLQSTFPILFQQIEGQSHPLPVALMGLGQGENLFLQNGLWDSPIIPMMMQKGPFLIAKEAGLQGDVQTVIAIDESHPKARSNGGERVFSQTGGYTTYLENIIKVLERIEASHPHTLAFAAHLCELELLTPLEFRLTLDNGGEHLLTGLSGIDEDRLATLTSDQLLLLHSRQFLLPLFMVVASQSQMARLISLKNQTASER